MLRQIEIQAQCPMPTETKGKTPHASGPKADWYHPLAARHSCPFPNKSKLDVSAVVSHQWRRWREALGILVPDVALR